MFQVAHLTQEVELQINGRAMCSRSLRRRAASIFEQLERLQGLNFSHQLRHVSANVDSATALQVADFFK
jgi:hypothetical protein